MEPSAESLIAERMPRYALRQIDRMAVAAAPADAYAAARNVDMYRIPFVRGLFELRIAPDRLVAWLRREPYAANLSSRIEDIARPGSGFLVLGEVPGREVVVGSIGKFWQPTIEFAQVAAAEFKDFAQPGYGKLAWCIRVDPRAGGGSWVTVELRVGATDPRSLVRFKRYWALIGRFSHAIRHGVMHMLMAQLGPAASEDSRGLPGDALFAQPKFQRTHATTIEAPVEQVWPWLVQMGARRAGWYSFDFLDNGGSPSAERILPELQNLRVGDIIPALPASADGFAVLAMDRPRSLVLGDPSLLAGGTRPAGAPPWKTSWAFVLEPIGHAATRLIVRVRADYAPDAKMALLGPMLGVAHEIMERRQLHNLRRRAGAMAHA